jgi:N12 class adenine-specific DNA methylase
MESIQTTAPAIEMAAGEKAKARAIIAAIRTLQRIEREGRPANPDERRILAGFPGFGPVALSLFPHFATGRYKDAGWQALGEELTSLLTPEQYDSARATVYNQFFTAPIEMRAMHAALKQLGVPATATVLEPGCGVGNFMSHAPDGMRFIGIEKDGLTGRIARALHPGHDIRIEPFQDSRLPAVDAVIGNPPFGDVDITYGKQKLALHDFFIAKGVDALRPGGVLAVVTSHFTLDKQNAAARQYLADRADFLGAIRLPSDAFHRQGTSVVTDIVFLRKRADGQQPNHVDPDWLETSVIGIPRRRGSGVQAAGVDLPVNRYFLNHHAMVLGDWSGEDTLHGAGFSVRSNGDLAGQLRAAIDRLPRFQVVQSEAEKPNPPPAFTPPPPEPYVTEGSFFVGPDRTIYQLNCGQGLPVTYGGKLLKSDGDLVGRRMGCLIKILALARRVLQSQNEGWPEANRADARKELNRAYDLFVAAYGPINKTTFGEKADGTVIRRMPNLVKFREDPDAMLVMSLEEYDEVTGTAEKAAIMRKDVVGRSPDVTAVTSAEEGLLVSLDRKGTVDLPYIAALYGKPEDRVIAELSDLMYRDPDSGSWQTADMYLSGNVRAKLAAAERAGPDYARNAVALRSVQPEDVLPGDIDANLGAPWIPESDIQAFAAGLFNVAPAAIRVAHLKKDAVWSVDADATAGRSVAATAEVGTLRANGVVLLEQALNLKTPTIYDMIQNGDRKEPVVNQEATLAARDKQRQIKDRFRAWVFSDADRTERLVREYNDTYNNLRPRLFDGSHLDFPGMNRTITLNPHQKDAVWRGMSGGNTLLAHVVGAGKTFTMGAMGMKMNQAGLRTKPMYVVPNHMLEQFARELMQLYPNARLLIATKDDMARDRRKLLTAKIASGDWDGIIVTHSSFERIGMSRDYQERFLREQIKEYEQLLGESARSDSRSGNRNIIKAIEKQKANRQERLKDLLAQDKKDDGLVFDELGVDQIFIDEFQAYKNLEAPTKMDRVAGIPTGGSERAFDLYMKCRYLDGKHPGHGVVGASGTPISNSMVEVYTLQRYFDPKAMAERGIDHLDGWAATFGEVVESMEISPDGATLKPRSRFAKFVNMPELSQMFRAFADVQTAEMLNLPRPALEGGKPQTIACAMSDEQAELQAGLVKRYERIRNEKVDPREDNALKITTDGRKLALDARMLGWGSDFPGSKINELVGNVVRIWRNAEPIRGTQMVFCDLGVHPNPFSVYDEIRQKLVDHGMPRDQIAVIGDADSDAKKQVLFEKVRQGTVRVLIGSTQKMGTGTNAQRRMVGLHHLDVPWRPSDIEQRDGRMVRQGNMNAEVGIYRYVTKGSFDAFMWQANETKARFTNQFMTGDGVLRRIEDISSQELSYAEVKAIASGNPAVLTLAETDAELQRLAVLRRNHDDEQFIARRSRKELPGTISRLADRVAGLAADMAVLGMHAGDPLSIDGRACSDKEAIEIMNRRLQSLPTRVRETRNFPLGVYRGLELGIALHAHGNPEMFLEGALTRYGSLSRDSAGPRAILNAAERLAGTYAAQAATARQDLAIAEGQLRDYEARLGAPFAYTAYVAELTRLRDQLKAGLSSATPEPGAQPLADVQETAERITALKAAHSIEAEPQRQRSRSTSTAERPVTARIRERLGTLSATMEETAAVLHAVADELPPPRPADPLPLVLPAVLPLQTDDAGAPSGRPGSSFCKRVDRVERRPARQMSLF